ncbi:hypothetical protein DYU05_15220 [Mucilaginibacter terrenus]|uniref:Lipoprotein n=1 Tax=Mucilaginibacter terrenus TaxID=2482727 RepID=A0A3E2NR61_9SPHI|nr:hypothetical protein [Mucilaginibacter terrenus]RFZ83477.1 hypothetical protein DYU05_15220 [Mucilaginibacter terrenus]
MNFSVTKYLLIIMLAGSLAGCGDKNKGTTDNVAAVKGDSTVAVGHVDPNAGKLLGVWHDATIHTEKGEQIAYELVAKDDKYYMQVITFTATNLTVNDAPPISPSASELKKDGARYTAIDDPSQAYEVDKAGDLLIYNGAEIVTKCSKLL